MANKEAPKAEKKEHKPGSKVAPKEPKAGAKPEKKGGEKGGKAAAIEIGSSSNATRSRMQDVYRDQIVPALMKKFGYKTVMQVPRLQKITLNMGVSEAVADKKVMDNAVADLTKIAGQKPVVTKSRKAIANFKIRENVPIGTMVTLRGVRMYEFLDRFVTIALPRVRDFRGISGRSFDGRGNYNVGVKEQIIFPEIEYDKIDAIRGLNISITTSAKTDDECKALLQAFRFPFKN
jgi:large subunit ribosomal protein L5